MTVYLVGGLVCVGVATAVAGLAPLVTRLRGSLKTKVRKRFEREFGGPPDDTPLLAFENLQKLAASEARNGSRLFRRVATLTEHSGLGITPGQLLKIAVASAVGLGVVAAWVKGGVLAAAVGAAAGAVLPLLYVRHRAIKRNERLLAQLPEILDLAARFLKAGHSLSQALGSVATELKDPARELFARYASQRDLGLPTEVALRELADRAGLTEYRIMTMAILVQQETGGNLAEVCTRLAAVVRDRFRVQGMIRGLTAEGRMQAAILTALPPALVVLMMAVKPSYADAMLSQPKLIAGILLSQLIGILWIRKIVKINF
jgi:tight adherence protein B